MNCYLIEDSKAKIRKIKLAFNKCFGANIDLKWVDKNGAVNTDLLDDYEDYNNGELLKKLKDLPNVENSVFLIDLAITETERDIVESIQMGDPGTFKAHKAASIVRELQKISGNIKIVITTMITMELDAWQECLTGIPEANPLEAADLKKMGFIASVMFEPSNLYEDEIKKAFEPFLV